MPDKYEDQKFVSTDQKHETWVNSKWRPLMGWLYMATCAFDFIIAPILWPIFQAAMKMPVKPWTPITLEGAGLYHLAMGAIVGVTSWQRSQERISAMGLQMNYSNSSVIERKIAAARAKSADDGDADKLIDRKRKI